MDREPEGRPFSPGFPYALIAAGLFLLAIAWSCGW
jgi:hypothetical protein